MKLSPKFIVDEKNNICGIVLDIKDAKKIKLLETKIKSFYDAHIKSLSEKALKEETSIDFDKFKNQFEEE